MGSSLVQLVQLRIWTAFRTLALHSRSFTSVQHRWAVAQHGDADQQPEYKQASVPSARSTLALLRRHHMCLHEQQAP